MKRCIQTNMLCTFLGAFTVLDVLLSWDVREQDDRVHCPAGRGSTHDSRAFRITDSAGIQWRRSLSKPEGPLWDQSTAEAESFEQLAKISPGRQDWSI